MQAFWVTDKQGEVALTQMTSNHLINCVRYLESGRMRRPGCNGFTNREWVKIMRAELQRRSRMQR